MTDLPVIEGSQPTEPSPLVDEVAASRWPTVIGVISIIYAIGGMLCAVGSGIGSFLTEALMGMAGMSVTMPFLMKITEGVMALMRMLAGVILLSGAIATVRRKRTGPSTLRKWAVFRIVLLLLGAILTVATAPAQIVFQRSKIEAQMQRMTEAGQSTSLRPLTDQQVWTSIILQLAVISALSSAYPLFIGFYLSRKKINDEVAEWR